MDKIEKYKEILQSLIEQKGQGIIVWLDQQGTRKRVSGIDGEH